ncbi:MAG: hypothetical protein ACKVOJ_12605 [Sphingomonadaceae bacterium]
MRIAFACALMLSACTQGPKAETSEAALANQAKAIENAADTMVNQTMADITTEDQVEPIKADANDNAVKPIMASGKPRLDSKK